MAVRKDLLREILLAHGIIPWTNPKKDARLHLAGTQNPAEKGSSGFVHLVENTVFLRCIEDNTPDELAEEIAKHLVSEDAFPHCDVMLAMYLYTKDFGPYFQEMLNRSEDLFSNEISYAQRLSHHFGDICHSCGFGVLFGAYITPELKNKNQMSSETIKIHCLHCVRRDPKLACQLRLLPLLAREGLMAWKKRTDCLNEQAESLHITLSPDVLLGTLRTINLQDIKVNLFEAIGADLSFTPAEFTNEGKLYGYNWDKLPATYDLIPLENLHSDGRGKISRMVSYLLKNQPCGKPVVTCRINRENTVYVFMCDPPKLRENMPTCGSAIHTDPAAAMNLMFIPNHWKQHGANNQIGAIWMIVKPTKIQEAIGHLKDLGLLRQIMTKEQMIMVQEKMGIENCFVVEQSHGDMLKIPVGYAHAVVNLNPNVKLAIDFLEEGCLHEPMVVHTQITLKGEKIYEHDYLKIGATILAKSSAYLDSEID